MNTTFLFLTLIILTIQAWQIGFYQQDSQCLPWDSSWREWSDSTSWDSWEIYMFLNSTNNLWQFCPDGEYYDFSLEVCTSWGASCSGYWAYQSSWLSCNPGESFDLDSLSWVPTCDPNKIEITNSNLLEIDSVWRDLSYYIDPSSEKLMELGTKDFPFRTILPAFLEIMELFSNSENEITIYIKENTTVYIEDSTIFLLDIGFLMIDVYRDFNSDNNLANIITTDSSIIKFSKKAAFNIMKDSTIDIQNKILQGNFTTEEIAIIGREGDTFQLVRSSLSIKNIIVRREAASILSGLFINAIYLQNK